MFQNQSLDAKASKRQGCAILVLVTVIILGCIEFQNVATSFNAWNNHNAFILPNTIFKAPDTDLSGTDIHNHNINNYNINSNESLPKPRFVTVYIDLSNWTIINNPNDDDNPIYIANWTMIFEAENNDTTKEIQFKNMEFMLYNTDWNGNSV